MRICTRTRDAAEYIQNLEAIVIAMAVDISKLTKTSKVVGEYTPEEIIDNYIFVTSEPSIIEEIAYRDHGIPYLERKSTLAHLMEIGVVLRDTMFE